MNEWETVERALRRLVIAAGALALTESSIDKYAMEYQGALAALRTLGARCKALVKAATVLWETNQFGVRICPHGNAANQGWWCDECWNALGDALKPIVEVDDGTD